VGPTCHTGADTCWQTEENKSIMVLYLIWKTTLQNREECDSERLCIFIQIRNEQNCSKKVGSG
jgi:phosphoribosyl-AMP cyclohydrolase